MDRADRFLYAVTVIVFYTVMCAVVEAFLEPGFVMLMVMAAFYVYGFLAGHGMCEGDR
jgi:hypothetical protein